MFLSGKGKQNFTSQQKRAISNPYFMNGGACNVILENLFSRFCYACDHSDSKYRHMKIYSRNNF